MASRAREGCQPGRQTVLFLVLLQKTSPSETFLVASGKHRPHPRSLQAPPVPARASLSYGIVTVYLGTASTPETFCTMLCLINYRSVIVVVLSWLPVIFSVFKNIPVLRILYYCKRSGLTFSFTVRTKNNASSLLY